MTPRQVSNRLEAVTTQLYRAMILLEKNGERLEDLRISCDDIATDTPASYSSKRAAGKQIDQASYDLAGLHDAIQEVIYKIDEAVSELSVL